MEFSLSKMKNQNEKQECKNSIEIPFWFLVFWN